MDSEGWSKTKKGKIVYREGPSPFSDTDAARVLRSVLEFDVTVDDDAQVSELLYFLFGFGFLPLNLTINEKTKEREIPTWYRIISPVINAVADEMGVPDLAQTFANRLGDFLQDLVDPPGKEYMISSKLVELMVQQIERVKKEGRGFEWRLKR